MRLLLFYFPFGLAAADIHWHVAIIVIQIAATEINLRTGLICNVDICTTTCNNKRTLCVKSTTSCKPLLLYSSAVVNKVACIRATCCERVKCVKRRAFVQD